MVLGSSRSAHATNAPVHSTEPAHAHERSDAHPDGTLRHTKFIPGPKGVWITQIWVSGSHVSPLGPHAIGAADGASRSAGRPPSSPHAAVTTSMAPRRIQQARMGERRSNVDA